MLEFILFVTFSILGYLSGVLDKLIGAVANSKEGFWFALYYELLGFFLTILIFCYVIDYAVIYFIPFLCGFIASVNIPVFVKNSDHDYQNSLKLPKIKQFMIRSILSKKKKNDMV